MSKKRTYSQYTIKALHLFSDQIILGRKQHKWTEQELAERAGISRATLQKIEKGNLNCAVGLVFEVAVLVGVKLFETEQMSLTVQQERIYDRLALLPKSVQKKNKSVNDDF